MIVCLTTFPPAAQAQELPDTVSNLLTEETINIEQVSDWQLSDVFGWLADLAGHNLEEPLQFAFQAGTYLLLAGVFGLLVNGDSWRRCLEAVSLLGFGTLCLGAMMQLTDSVVTAAQDCQNYLVAFVPVYSGVALMGGQSAGALVYSGMFFTMSGFLAGAIRMVLLPVMQIYFCFAACACIWGNAGIEEAASLFARCLHWMLRLCGILFSLVLGLQNVLAGSVDTAAVRTGKSVLQGFIPVVGDAAVALAALGALAAAFAPVLLQCLLYVASFAGTGILASLIGQKQCGRLCHLYGEGARLCASILILYFFMVFLSTALLLITGNGG